MQPVTLAVRKAFAQALTGIVYKTKPIYVYEEMVTESQLKDIKSITVGNVQVIPYILLLNQTANDNSAKCRRNDQCSIQVQIITKFPIGSGGSITAEEISIEVLNKLFPTNDLKAILQMPAPFDCWRATLESTRNIPYKDETNNVWVHNMVFLLWVGQDN